MSKKCSPGKVDKSELQQQTADWVSSSEGREALSKASEASHRLTAKLEEDRQIDPRILNEPITL